MSALPLRSRPPTRHQSHHLPFGLRRRWLRLPEVRPARCNDGSYSYAVRHHGGDEGFYKLGA